MGHVHGKYRDHGECACKHVGRSFNPRRYYVAPHATIVRSQLLPLLRPPFTTTTPRTQVASHVDPYVIRLLTQLTLFILLHHFVACLYWAIAWQTPDWNGGDGEAEEVIRCSNEVAHN